MKKTFRIGHVFCGVGGKGLGAKEALARFGEHEATFETIGGIDVDPQACRDFEMLVGAPTLCADVHQLEPADLIAFFGPEAPDAIMMSPPCKGFSGLLSAKRAREDKYQKMNALMERALFLVCETWDRPPPLIFVENVPRIMSRGRATIERCVAMGHARGYAIAQGTHNCGEIGALAQNRMRYFMLWRHREQVPQFVYQPPKERVRACGEVLGPLPMPGDVEAAGPMHGVPRLSWRNWLRLALIPAGGDWRDLPGVLADGQKRREQFRRAPVTEWAQPAETVTGPGGSAAAAVADPRVVAIVGLDCEPRAGAYGVLDHAEPAPTITGSHAIDNAPAAIADDRVRELVQLSFSNGRHWNKYAVTSFDEPAQTVIGAIQPGSGAPAVADPRIAELVTLPPNEHRDWYANVYRVGSWNGPAGTVTGSGKPSSGQFSVADPRIPLAPNDARHRHKLEVLAWDQEARTVTGTGTVGGGAPSVADPRFANVDRVTDWDAPVGTITRSPAPSSGGAAVADPRWGGGRLGVTSWDEPSGTVAGESLPNNGKFSVADPRFADGKKKNWQRVAGVTAWTSPAETVTGGAKIHAGAFQVADPRIAPNPRYRILTLAEALALDLNPDRPPPFIPIIIAADGTWHRPLTTLELAVLQSFPWIWRGAPLVLAGTSHTRWREAIGNAVPPAAARKIAEQLARALLIASVGGFALDNNEIWVAPMGALVA